MKFQIASRRTAHRGHDGFTILEVMLALTASVVILLITTRVLRSLGDRITDSQSDITLNADLRDHSIRIRGDLRRSHIKSVGGQPNLAEGYLTYYEGHMTDATTTHVALARADRPDVDVDYLPINRFGDIDDYLAFTATATDGQPPFMGYIPRGVLAAHVFVDLFRQRGAAPTLLEIGRVMDLPGAYTAEDASELVPFFSNRAEIVYYTSPQWNGVPADGLPAAQDPFGGRPTYRDLDGDLLPDRMRLHRRVLLVRDDLNMSLTDIDTFDNGGYAPADTPPSVDALPFLFVSGTAAQLQPLSTNQYSLGTNGTYDDGDPQFEFGTNAATWGQRGPSTTLDAPGRWSAGVTGNSPNWLAGLARLQQVMDLSLARYVNEQVAPTPLTATDAVTGESYGMPSRLVFANSLASLSEPQNRFAHVRMPRALLAATPTGSTMPMLALGPPIPFLTANEAVHYTEATPQDFHRFPAPAAAGTFPPVPTVVRHLGSQADPDGVSASATAGTHQPADRSSLSQTDIEAFYVNRFGKFTMTGFLRPEFLLSDRAYATNQSDYIEINRARQDVIVDDLLSFDVRIFADNIPAYTYLGHTTNPYDGNGEPGGNGIDDDDNGTIDDTGEVGWAGNASDDQPIDLDSLNVFRTQQFTPGAANGYFAVDGTRGFVDLNFLRLAGHQLGGAARPGVTRTTLFNGGLLGTDAADAAAGKPIFGINEYPPGTDTIKPFPLNMQAAGMFVINQGSTAMVNSFFQSRFETRVGYEADDFDQESAAGITDAAYTQQYGTRDNTGVPVSVVGGNVFVSGRTWTPAQPVAPGNIVAPALDINANAPNTPGALETSSATDYQSPPPVNQVIPGIQVYLRLYDSAAGRIRQQAITVSLR